MANTIGYGQGAINNTIDWGQGATDNTIDWGKSQTLSPGGETNITGGGGASYSTNSFEFDGLNDGLGFGSTFSLSSAAFSISIWFKWTGDYVNSEMFILGQRTSNGNYFQFLSSTQIRLKIQNSTKDFTSSSITIPQNTWSHLMVIRNESNSLQPYINGQAFGTAQSITTGISLDSFGRVINASFGFKGFLDELSIYNTDQTANVATIYGSGKPTDVSGLSPIINLRMGENATFDSGTGRWTATSIGSDTRTATSQNMTEAARTTDVPI